MHTINLEMSIVENVDDTAMFTPYVVVLVGRGVG